MGSTFLLLEKFSSAEPMRDTKIVLLLPKTGTLERLLPISCLTVVTVRECYLKDGCSAFQCRL